ncbi:MAG TPA: hypothetical protein VI954_01080 [Candidatus Paceibacterota bacterium]
MGRRYGEITKEILHSIITAGVLTLVATSPYFGIQLFRTLLHEPSQRRKFSRALNRLKQSRLILLKEKLDGTILAELTEQGRRKMREFQFADLKIKKPKKWDRIWRVVIFDIPRKKVKERESFRGKLREAGFYQLQESVWAFPYPCQAEIEFAVELLGLYPYVNMLEARNIKDDAKIKKYFSLL